MSVQRCYVEYIALNGGSRLISSSEGVQREAGGSLPLGAVGTPTKVSTYSDPINFFSLFKTFSFSPRYLPLITLKFL